MAKQGRLNCQLRATNTEYGWTKEVRLPLNHGGWIIARGGGEEWRAAPDLATIAPIMGARVVSSEIGTALFWKTRRAVLALFYARPDETFYLRQLTREVQAVQVPSEWVCWKIRTGSMTPREVGSGKACDKAHAMKGCVGLLVSRPA